MTLAPFLNAPFVIQLHIIAALMALSLGPVALLRRSRDRVHRLAGRAWIAAMAVTALSSFFIYTIRLVGPFSPIHILSIITLVGLWEGLRQVRAGRIADHKRTMMSLYVFGMGIPGLFTLLPGRIMNAIVFPQAPWVGFWAAVATMLIGGLAWAWSRPGDLRQLLRRA